MGNATTSATLQSQNLQHVLSRDGFKAKFADQKGRVTHKCQNFQNCAVIKLRDCALVFAGLGSHTTKWVPAQSFITKLSQTKVLKRTTSRLLMTCFAST